MSRMVRVLRTSVGDLDRLDDEALQRHVSELERELRARAGDDRKLKDELDRCRRALEPDFDQKYHSRDCYVPDQSHIRRPTMLVPLEEIPAGAQPCQICGPGRPISAGSNDPPYSAPHSTSPDNRSAAVRVGSTVVAVDEDTGEHVRYEIVQSGARASLNQISAGAPIAKALLGAEIGDVRTARLPRGERHLRVVDLPGRS